jgi:hypothetical protein
MSLNDIKDEFESKIAIMASDLNNSLPMSTPQLRKAFSDAEIKEVHALIKKVNEASDKNRKILELIMHAETAFKLLKKLGVGI